MNPISLQLYTIHPNTSEDFAGAVAEVAKIGYQAVELAGFGNLKPAEAAQALENAGLKVSGMHMGLEWFTEKFDELKDMAKLFQTKEMIIPGTDPKRYASKEACLAFGEELNGHGAKARAAGLNLSWHNHDKEFAIFDGRPALEWMLEAAEPRHLASEVDLFWVAVAGCDPVKAVTRLGARARMLHLKDGVGRKSTDLGQGEVDFKAIFKLAEDNHLTEWYVVEQEEFAVSRMESVRVAYEYLKSLGKS
jgi:sugar phosphate isomerase/epimerase